MLLSRWLLLSLGTISLLGCTSQVAEEPRATESQPDPSFVARPAEVGVGIKGRSLEKDKGIEQIITAPAIAFFKTKEKIAFEIAVPHALDLYNAEKGRFPRTHEEFWTDIIEFNQIKLPKLPAGQIYRYHPDDHLLWVEPAPAETTSNP